MINTGSFWILLEEMKRHLVPIRGFPHSTLSENFSKNGRNTKTNQNAYATPKTNASANAN